MKVPFQPKILNTTYTCSYSASSINKEERSEKFAHNIRKKKRKIKRKLEILEKRKQDSRRNWNPKMELNLCLGLPGSSEKAAATVAGNKRAYSETVDLKLNLNNEREKKNKEVSLISNDNTSSICSKDPAKPPAK